MLGLFALGVAVVVVYVSTRPQLRTVDNTTALVMIPAAIQAPRISGQPSLLKLATERKPTRQLLSMLRADMARRGIELTDEQMGAAHDSLVFAGATDNGVPS